MKYLLAHDLGTSGNKATLFTTDGTLVTSFTYEYETKWYNDVWAEQDPEVWFEAVKESTKEVMIGINPEDVLALSFSGQMMGCLCVDDHGQPLYPSIIWADSRASEEASFMKAQMPEIEFYRITGHRPSASYGLAKLLWIKNHYPEVYETTYKILNAKDYIIYRLTGKFVTDYSDASGTNLLDINTLAWSEDIADAMGIDLVKLPDLRASTDVIGRVLDSVANDLGLSHEIKVVCGGGDGSMSAVGAGCIAPGDAFCTLGTSAWNATTSKQPVFDSDMRTFNWVHIVPGYYVPCGTMQAAGASMSWLRDNLAYMEQHTATITDGSAYDAMNKLVASTPPGANGVYYLPYLMGERSPRWNPKARGSFVGMKMETTRGDMFRAVYEGVALNLAIILNLVVDTDYVNKIVMTGGGAQSQVWRQIFANIYNLIIEVPNYIEEATSIGAAVTAGVGIGIYEDFDCIHSFIEMVTATEPEPEVIPIYDEMKPVFEAMYQALKPVYEQL